MFNCREGVSREGWRRGAVPRKVRRRRTQSTGLGVQPRSRWDQSGDGPGVGDAAAAPDAGAGEPGLEGGGRGQLTAVPSLLPRPRVADSTDTRRGRGELRPGVARRRAVRAGESGRLPGGGEPWPWRVVRT